MADYNFEEFKNWLEEEPARKKELERWEEFLDIEGDNEWFEKGFVVFSTEELKNEESEWTEYCEIVLEWKAEVDQENREEWEEKKTLAEWLIADLITQQEFNLLDDLFADKRQKFSQEELTNRLLAEQQKREQKLKEWQEWEKKDQAKWFSPRRWLIDKEIDWALEQISLNSTNNHFAVLQSWQAIITRYEANREDSPELFTIFYQQLNQNNKEIVIIPVNKYQSHWSLLVYEVNTQIFHHYDTASGMNWNYIRPLCQQILVNRGIYKEEQSEYLKTHHDFSQGNGHDCGVGVIALAERLMAKYPQKEEELFKDLDLGAERKKWRNKIKEVLGITEEDNQQEQPTKSKSFFDNFSWWWLLLTVPVVAIILIIRKGKEYL